MARVESELLGHIKTSEHYVSAGVRYVRLPHDNIETSVMAGLVEIVNWLGNIMTGPGLSEICTGRHLLDHARRRRSGDMA